MTVGTRCPGCGAVVPEVEETDTHTYIGSAPGCWLRYSEMLAREYGDIRYTPAHQLTVDTYAVQHPGITVLDIQAAATPAEHRERVNEWARSAWEAWPRTAPRFEPGPTSWADSVSPTGVQPQLAPIRNHAEEQDAMEERDLECRELTQIERGKVGESQGHEQAVLGHG
jgi:hypothetical protein